MVKRAEQPSDTGLIAGAEVLPFGLLLFVVGSLFVAQIWAVIDAKFATDSAAREAARTYAEATAPATPGGAGAQSHAIEAGTAALLAHGRDAGRAQLTASVEGSGTANPTDGFQRCGEATFTATYQVPMLVLPWVGGFGDGIEVSSEHTAIVDPFRDGVPGSVTGCL